MGALGAMVTATHTATATYAEDVWNRFDTFAEGPILAVATIALVITGYLLITGQLSLAAGPFFSRLFRWVVMVAVLLNMPGIFDWSFRLVTQVPNAVAVFLLGTTSPVSDEGEVIDLIEDVMNAGIEGASAIWAESGYLDLTSHIISGMLFLTGLILAVLAGVILMVSKLGVGILLAVAPFFLLIRLLDIGRGLFEGWLRQLMTFALVPVFVYSLIGLNFTILNAAHVQLTAAIGAGDLSFTAAVPYLLVSIVNMVLLTQVMGWAGGVGGGIALAVSAGGVAAGVATAAKMGMAGSRATQKAVSVGAPVVAAGATSVVRNVARNLGRF